MGYQRSHSCNWRSSFPSWPPAFMAAINASNINGSINQQTHEGRTDSAGALEPMGRNGNRQSSNQPLENKHEAANETTATATQIVSYQKASLVSLVSLSKLYNGLCKLIFFCRNVPKGLLGLPGLLSFGCECLRPSVLPRAVSLILFKCVWHPASCIHP